MPVNLPIQFAQPYWLLLTPCLLLLSALLYRFTRLRPLPFSTWLEGLTTEVYHHPLTTVLSKREGITSTKRLHYRQLTLLANLILLLLLLSMVMAQPYRIGKRLPDPPTHRDVVFLLDTSVSMLLRDYVVEEKRIDRLTMLKNVLSHFVDNLQGNRIQLIAYAENAYTLVPATNDYALLKFQLQRLQAATLTGRSSDLSHALLYALNSNEHSAASEAKPVFVMLTDASRPDRRIDPRVAAAYVAEQGIRLHTIAIGAGSYAAEDTENVSLIYHPTSFALLQDIARLGAGQFFWAKDPASLRSAFETIQSAEKRQQAVEPIYKRHPLYYWPLAAALGWILALYFVSLIRRGQAT